MTVASEIKMQRSRTVSYCLGLELHYIALSTLNEGGTDIAGLKARLVRLERIFEITASA